jgi:hypothetical protein
MHGQTSEEGPHGSVFHETTFVSECFACLLLSLPIATPAGAEPKSRRPLSAGDLPEALGAAGAKVNAPNAKAKSD